MVAKKRRTVPEGDQRHVILGGKVWWGVVWCGVVWCYLAEPFSVFVYLQKNKKRK